MTPKLRVDVPGVFTALVACQTAVDVMYLMGTFLILHRAIQETTRRLRRRRRAVAR